MIEFMCVLDYVHAYTVLFFFFFFKQKTAYEMRISDWSSDVCSSDLQRLATQQAHAADAFVEVDVDLGIRIQGHRRAVAQRYAQDLAGGRGMVTGAQQLQGRNDA